MTIPLKNGFSLKLNRLNVFMLTLISAVLLIGATTVLIAFTPIREYIPGYADITTKRNSIELTKETDSIQQVLRTNEEFYGRIKMLLNGDITTEEYERIDSIAKVETDIETADLAPIKEDSL